MSDHGLDLEAIAARAGGHSIFAPSYSATWLTCSGSLLPSIFADDTAGVDASYGTAGHELAEIWLNRIVELDMRTGDRISGILAERFRELVDLAEPRELLDTTVTVVQRAERTETGDDGVEYVLPEISYEIERDEDMFAYVREYVEWCAILPGEHAIEKRVDFSNLTPIPNQGGTADHAAFQAGHMTITDLKMGKGIRVQAAYIDMMDSAALLEYGGVLSFNGNPQALIYAIGTFLEWDWLYHFETIDIRICQPRLSIFETWTTNRAELLRFMDYVKQRALDAWVPNAPRTPSDKGCAWCKVRGTCPAILTWAMRMHEKKFDDIEVDGEGVISGVAYSVNEMTSAAERFVSARTPFDKMPSAPSLSTEALEKAIIYRKLFEKWFADIDLELINRSLAGEELNRHKLAEGRTMRKFKDHAQAVIYLRRKLGLDVDDLYKETLLSPAQIEELIHRKLRVSKKEAERLVAQLVFRPKGRLTLAPLADKRPGLKPPTDAFDDLEVEDSL